MSCSASIEECFLGTVTVGERGQIVIPAEARKKLSIHSGEKLFVCIHPSGQGLMVIKIDAVRELLGHLTSMLGPAERPDAGGGKGSTNSRAEAGESAD